MSILIKNMNMPTNCWACACYHRKVDDGYYDYDICQASGTVFNDGYASATGHKTHIDPSKQRLDNCPLFHVLPHGDLIERKAAYDSLLYGMVMTGYQSRALDCIDEYSVPTIIPAEKGET